MHLFSKFFLNAILI